jgi:hypothetical protein
MERRYDPQADSITNEVKLLSTEGSIKIGTRWFAKLFGADFALDTDGEEWRWFKQIIKVRNQFTHPKTLEHFYSGPALGLLHPTADWFAEQMQCMFAKCCTNLGYPPPRQQESPSKSVVKIKEQPSLCFTEAELDQIQDVPARALKYLEIVLLRSGREIKLGIDLVDDSSRPFLGHGHQYAARSAVRTQYSEVEGYTATVLFFLRAGERWGEIWLSEADREALATREIEDKLVAALTIFSREFGYNYVPETAGDLWRQFRGARFFRDRLTHPKEPASLQVDDKSLLMVLNAAKYFNEALSAALRIDPYKFASKAKLLDKIIAEGREGELRQLARDG